MSGAKSLCLARHLNDAIALYSIPNNMGVVTHKPICRDSRLEYVKP